MCTIFLGTTSTKGFPTIFGDKGKYALVLVIAFLALVVPMSVFAFTFSRNLTLGDSGPDVLELQKILNTDERTRVATAGPGAPGSETTYFGTLTANAVRRYQELYREEILIPQGLFAGTGYFGQSTRAHIEGGETITKYSPVIRSTKPHIFSIDPERGTAGTEITIYGEGFLETGNQVSTAFEQWNDVESFDDGTALTVTVQGPFPKGFLKENLDAYRKFSGDERESMEYPIWVSNENGRSNTVPFIFLFEPK